MTTLILSLLASFIGCVISTYLWRIYRRNGVDPAVALIIIGLMWIVLAVSVISFS